MKPPSQRVLHGGVSLKGEQVCHGVEDECLKGGSTSENRNIAEQRFDCNLTKAVPKQLGKKKKVSPRKDAPTGNVAMAF